jgi:hypothetical protein
MATSTVYFKFRKCHTIVVTALLGMAGNSEFSLKFVGPYLTGQLTTRISFTLSSKLQIYIYIKDHRGEDRLHVQQSMFNIHRLRSHCEEINFKFMWLMMRSRRRGLVNTVMNLQVPHKAGNSLTSSVNVSFSTTLLHGVIFLTH